MIKGKVKNNSFLKSSFIYTVSDTINKGIPVLLMPILISHLSPEEYGTLANGIALLRIFSAFIGLNSVSYYSSNYYLSEEAQKKSQITAISQITILTAIVVALILVLFESAIYKITGLQLDWVLTISLIAFLDVFVLLFGARFRLQKKASASAILDNSKSFLEITISLTFIIVLNYGFEGRIIGMLISSLIIAGYSFFRLKIGSILILQVKLLKDIVTFSYPIAFHQLFLWLRNGYDRFLLTSLFAASVTGEFTVGYQCGMGLFLITGAFNKAYTPFLFEKLSSPTKEGFSKIKKLLAIYTVLVIVSTFAVLAAGYVYINYIAPVEYKSSIDFFYWVLLGQFFHAFYLVSNGFLFFYRATGVLGKITASMTVIHLILAYILAMYYGPIGIVVSNSFVFLVNTLFVSFQAFKITKSNNTI